MYSLSVLIHGHSKVGKSTLAATAPFPICIFDAEGSTKFLKIRKRPWNPVREPPPAYDGTWDACIVNVTDIVDIEEGLRWLESGQHHFRSVVLDSVTETQRKLKTKIAGSDALDWPGWDELLRKLDGLVRGIRDLTQHPTNPLLAAVMVCESKADKGGKLKPNLQGSIAPSVPYWFDIVGYIWTEKVLDPTNLSPVLDANGKPVKARKLFISADDPRYEAGERVQGLLPDIIDSPNISQMLVTVFPELAAPTEQPQEAITNG